MGSQVVMKGKKVGSLYELIGSTIEGSTCVRFSMKYVDHTKWWLLRLGNMSERGLFDLSKKGLQVIKLQFYRVFLELCAW